MTFRVILGKVVETGCMDFIDVDADAYAFSADHARRVHLYKDGKLVASFVDFVGLIKMDNLIQS